jgi:SAM-dependent methyltransferase
MARADFNQVAAVYDAGRGLTEEALGTWREAVFRHLTGPFALPGLDLGCGTGRFTAALAGWLGCEMIGLDPANEMLAQASNDEPSQYVLGRAEAIPLKDGSCEFAWLSTVIHHFDDLGLVGRELRRVLRPGGAVLIRSWFPGRAEVTHFRYFPGARRIAETFPTISAVEVALGGSGFRVESLESVSQLTAPDLRAFYKRVRTRADTTLLRLSDEEFEEGLRLLEGEAAKEVEPQPVYSRLDLLVFR